MTPLTDFHCITTWVAHYSLQFLAGKGKNIFTQESFCLQGILENLKLKYRHNDPNKSLCCTSQSLC